MALIWSVMFAVLAGALAVVASAIPAGIGQLLAWAGVAVCAALFIALAVQSAVGGRGAP